MQLPQSRAIASRLEWLESAGSTNDILLAHASGEVAEQWQHLAVVATDTQTAGRGRLGRSWAAPPRSSLAVSVLVRPAIPVTAFGLLPLLAGVAMTDAIRSLGADAELKWPNDVLIGGRKVCGILSELLPDLRGAVIGSGVNLALSEQQLPVPTATSLAIEGVEADVDVLLSAYLTGLDELIAALVASGGDAEASGVRAAVADRCGTIGRPVRVILPDGTEVLGEAVGIDSTGRLLVSRGQAAEVLSVAAGDVTHLRY